MTTQKSSSPPREPPRFGFETLDNEYLLEEETCSWYDPEAFNPVRIGETFQSKYRVLGKLGYGSISTAWLCRDLIFSSANIAKHKTKKGFISISLPSKLITKETRKVDGDRNIYATKQVDVPDNPSHFVLCDFGDA
ncbi:hypothetical protein LSUB1_G000933 [Lachnellula subtilissima]|uniref:Uncharacterized protein n=1 Tax=Lachnellula subtilissima TaxID=602034 RepID=A0A8H8S4Z7_9HELO|nr:hypothetical protein LSUB1_G000933 [Lachnellula subtilissima]